jgi:hypothetical protein
MSGNQMSITQALAELKLLRKRLDSALDDAEFVTMTTKKNMLNKAAFAVDAKASLQSYRDLLARYNRIKAAIVESNARAKVTIAGKTYSVAEAVERKRSIQYEEELLDRLQRQWKAVSDEYDQYSVTEHARVDRLLSAELGKDSKTNVDVVQALYKTFLEESKAEIVDPINIRDTIRELRKSIDDFTTNVDWVLSEANGQTMIVIE